MEILDGIKEIKKHNKGEIQLKTTTLTNPSSAQIVRKNLALSQAYFADLMGVSIRTVQDWEQGRRTPKGPAKSLLRVADQHPEVFSDIH